ncbi:MAG: M23 family metallopeptidase [Chitinispirillaceae bacterium]|nr:M23 family metallopeptidase [Chitinispirillaceae bacterium]
MSTISSRFRHTRKKRPIKKLFTSLCAVAIILAIFFMIHYSDAQKTPEVETTFACIESLGKEIAIEENRLAEIKRVVYRREGTVGSGQGLFQALGNLGLSTQMGLKLITALSDSVELINMTVGERISVELDPNDTTNVLVFSYAPNPAIMHQLVNQDGTFIYHKVEHPTTIRHRLIEGSLEQGSTLDQTLREKGIAPSMVAVVNGVLLCKIAFRTHARHGDRFGVLLRERFFQDSILIEGQVMYTCYEGSKAGFHEAFRYDDGDPKSSFTAHYTKNGEALIHSGLRYPLDRLHISSGYGMRHHPVTGRRVMHKGVDYRAPTGTPTYAVAAGVVVQSSYNAANGNYIVIRHADKYTSWYLHLHKRLVNAGQTVRTRQLIGKVGNTGISTGPHLHFGFRKPNGSWMDPLQKRMIATPKLEGKKFAALGMQIREIRSLLDSLKTEHQPLVFKNGHDNRYEGNGS